MVEIFACDDGVETGRFSHGALTPGVASHGVPTPVLHFLRAFSLAVPPSLAVLFPVHVARS